jgi:hypothetical protein
LASHNQGGTKAEVFEKKMLKKIFGTERERGDRGVEKTK